jgi:hypothetical protein
VDDTPRGAFSDGRRKRRRWAAALAVLSLLGGAPARARALTLEEWLPGLTVTPFLSERLEYETNVFQTSTNEKSSMISRTSPGFLAEYGRGTLQLGAGYRAEILRYFDLKGLDTINHNFVGQAKLTLTKLQLMFRDDYVQTTVPPGTELTGPIKSSTNTLAPTAEYKLTDRFSLGANYTWTHVQFPGSDSSSAASAGAQAQQNQTVKQLDRNENLGGLTVFWKFRPAADLGIGYQYGTKSFDSATDRDARIHIVSLQVRGDVTSRLSSTFRIGITHREEVAGVAPNFTGVTIGGGWIYRLSERTTFTLDTDRSVQESVFENAQYYVSNSASFGVRQEFSRKLTASFRAAVGTNDYNTRQPLDTVRTKWRHDTLAGGILGLDYAIQPWLRTGLEYTFQNRGSNFRVFNYEDSRVSGRITLQF